MIKARAFPPKLASSSVRRQQTPSVSSAQARDDPRWRLMMAFNSHSDVGRRPSWPNDVPRVCQYFPLRREAALLVGARRYSISVVCSLRAFLFPLSLGMRTLLVSTLPPPRDAEISREALRTSFPVVTTGALRGVNLRPHTKHARRLFPRDGRP